MNNSITSNRNALITHYMLNSIPTRSAKEKAHIDTFNQIDYKDLTRQFHVFSRKGTYSLVRIFTDYHKKQKFLVITCKKFITEYKSGVRKNAWIMVPWNDFKCYKG